MFKRENTNIQPAQRKIFWFLALFICVFFLFTSACFKTSKVDLTDRIQRVENGLIPQPGIVIKGQAPQKMRLADRMEALRVPGVSIAVINDYKIEWAKGYGVKEVGGKEPVIPEILFQAASISKPVVSAAALHFVEQGILELDEDVNKKLVSWKVPENEFTKNKKVTLRGLLNHSAGLTVRGFRGYAQGEEIPTLLQILDGQKPANSDPIRVDIEPDSKFRYSGGGYTVVQQLLIDLLNKPFQDIMRETVFDPLGMANSTFEQLLPEPFSARVATGYRRDGKPVKGKWHSYPEMAAAGLWTTSEDLCRFGIEIMLSKAGKSNKILSKEMTQQMLTARFGDYGLGFIILRKDENFLFGHSGGNQGFKSYICIYPEKGQGAVIMTNGDYGSPLDAEILRSLSAEYGWHDFKPREKTVAEVDPEIYDSYVGTYQFTPKDKISITKEENRLFAEPVFVVPTGNTKCEIFPESETIFFMTKANPVITFQKDEVGKVSGLVLKQRNLKREATKLD